MASPPHSTCFVLVALGLFTFSRAGPLGPLPNITSVDLGFKDAGACTVGDVVYGAGEEVPGGAPCERCRCAGAAVRCERARCEPRPGCKALHRPDHCCPTYQCECEQEGRVYGNGEKLVDPQDPCRVCYCQGGEVVCRRIACFVRDDCTPRLVPGRCCPEYDNCPLRGVTTVPGMTPVISTEETSSSAAPVPKENIKQEITIKEITPVSEIPVITDVKIKEILPSSGIEVPNYSSSKSPLIVREATTENIKFNAVNSDIVPAIIEVQPSPSMAIENVESSIVPTKTSEIHEITPANDSPPSKISLSTQDSINSDIYSSSFATMGVPSIISEVIVNTGTTKAPLVEEEDQGLFDHNPAFPPIPDDLSVLGNHEDEVLPEQTADADHVLIHQGHSVVPSAPPEETTHREVFTTNSKETSKPSPAETTPAPTFNVIETSSVQASSNPDYSTTSFTSTAGSPSPVNDISTTRLETTVGTDTIELRSSPMLNLRSAIPTEILNVPSFVPEEINGEPDDVAESTTIAPDTALPSVSSTTENIIKFEEHSTEKIDKTEMIPEMTGQTSTTSESRESYVDESKLPDLPVEVQTNPVNTRTETYPDTNIATHEMTKLETTKIPDSKPAPSEQKKVVPDEKSTIVTEITAQTEFSSLPIETSDQNPKENSETIDKEINTASTIDPSPAEVSTSKMSTLQESEIITVSRTIPSNVDNNQSFENIETTEFIITPLGSSETSTDAVELIKISADPGQSAAIIEPAEKKNNVLTDLINLVGDVASIGEHTEGTAAPRDKLATSSLFPAASISDSEELIPVNAGYKSKNNNWNLNSITEIPSKSKNSPSTNKQKIVEIEDEESDSITDSPPPNDKVEPTTRRPIIDAVSDDGRMDNGTNRKDIEIITKSYVPTFNRRPTKVVMKKSSEQITAGAEGGSGEQSTLPAATSTTTAAPPATEATTATEATAATAATVTADASEVSTADPLH